MELWRWLLVELWPFSGAGMVELGGPISVLASGVVDIQQCSLVRRRNPVLASGVVAISDCRVGGVVAICLECWLVELWSFRVLAGGGVAIQECWLVDSSHCKVLVGGVMAIQSVDWWSHGHAKCWLVESWPCKVLADSGVVAFKQSAGFGGVVAIQSDGWWSSGHAERWLVELWPCRVPAGGFNQWRLVSLRVLAGGALTTQSATQ
ncbi:hypothetical protein CYMTET_36304, partial [Cymbomonas tetramitiformis]